MASEIDRALLEKAVDFAATAVKGAMGGADSKDPAYAADVFREIWKALQEAFKELPDKQRPGF
jgi:hypothetical protein